MKNPRVKEVIPTDEYELILHFTNDKQGIYDCKKLLDFGVFKELRDINYFKKVFVEYGTVALPNEQDICPDTIYLDSRILS